MVVEKKTYNCIYFDLVDVVDKDDILMPFQVVWKERS